MRCVHKPLPTRSELACEEVSIETAQSDDRGMFLTTLPATEVVPASVPDNCAIPNELHRPHGIKKPRTKIRRSQTATPNKRSKNTILNYFHGQKSSLNACRANVLSEIITLGENICNQSIDHVTIKEMAI